MYITYAFCNVTYHIRDISHMRFVTLQNAYAIYHICDISQVRFETFRKRKLFCTMGESFKSKINIGDEKTF